jgi:hypothetical protein
MEEKGNLQMKIDKHEGPEIVGTFSVDKLPASMLIRESL